MELRVYLKVCEVCGCLWYRTQTETGVYCSSCQLKLREFPTPQSRKRRGRPRKVTLPTVFAVASFESPDRFFKAETRNASGAPGFASEALDTTYMSYRAGGSNGSCMNSFGGAQ
jgi:hypothetical protein